MTNLQGKTLFITGASRGIGKAIALPVQTDICDKEQSRFAPKEQRA